MKLTWAMSVVFMLYGALANTMGKPVPIDIMPLKLMAFNMVTQNMRGLARQRKIWIRQASAALGSQMERVQIEKGFMYQEACAGISLNLGGRVSSMARIVVETLWSSGTSCHSS